MRPLYLRYRTYFSEKDLALRALTGLLFLSASLVVNFYAAQYAFYEKSSSVTDIILSNIPVIDVDDFFLYGAALLWIFLFLLALFDPRRIPFTFKAIALLVLVRSVFVSLTHIGPFPTHLLITSAFYSKISLGADLFFSGHTAFPFLMGFIFWETPLLRYFFFASSVFFGAIVLLAHLHYSIDVLSAFFIAYGTYKIAERIFKKDRRIFYSGNGNESRG